MAFVIKKKETFIWPVKIKSPADGGKYDEQTLELEFKKLTQSEVVNLVKDKDRKDSEFCRAVVVGWKNVQDADKNAIEFSSDTLDGLLEIFGVGQQIMSEYLNALGGSVIKN